VKLPNLNKSAIPTDGCYAMPLTDPSKESGAVRCYFRNIREALLRELEPHIAVFGCVAWLTDKTILEALAGKRWVSLLVQKEDFLRPDAAGQGDIRRAYARLGRAGARFELPGLISGMSTAADEDFAAVRCVGNHNSSKSPAHPRMHHKFVVMCDVDDTGSEPVFSPQKVWTGSFNFTHVGGLSLENAVVIADPVIAGAYLEEWSQVACLSEPLDWSTPWSAPEFRYGS
jgi:hypothetical protein